MYPRKIVAFAVLFLLFATQANAKGCTSYASQGAPQIVAFGQITVGKDVPIGQVIATRSTPGWTGGSGVCDKPRRTASLGIFRAPSPIAGVYATNVAGVGVRITYQGLGWPQVPVPDNFQVGGIFSAQVRDGFFTVQLVKTATDTGSGPITNGTLAYAGFDDHRQIWVDLQNTQIGTENPTCGFVSKQLLFDLGGVDGGALRADGHSAWVSQSLVGTGCATATEMALTFSSPADPHDASLFRIDDTSGAARGVAVELRSESPDQQALPNALTPLTLPAGREGRLYGFRARYRTTGAPLTAGSASLSIVVNVAYR